MVLTHFDYLIEIDATDVFSDKLIRVIDYSLKFKGLFIPRIGMEHVYYIKFLKRGDTLLTFKELQEKDLLVQLWLDAFYMGNSPSKQNPYESNKILHFRRQLTATEVSNCNLVI